MSPLEGLYVEAVTLQDAVEQVEQLSLFERTQAYQSIAVETARLLVAITVQLMGCENAE